MKCFVSVVFCFLPALLNAQGTKADYERANALRNKLANSTIDVPGSVTWIPGDRFYYRKSVKGGHTFVMVDAATGKKQPAFDAEKLAATLSVADKAKYTATGLPFQDFQFAESEKAITFAASGSMWKCALANYTCTKTGPVTAPAGRAATSPSDDPSPAEFSNDVVDGIVQTPSPQAPQAL